MKKLIVVLFIMLIGCDTGKSTFTPQRLICVADNKVSIIEPAYDVKVYDKTIKWKIVDGPTLIQKTYSHSDKCSYHPSVMVKSIIVVKNNSFTYE